MVRPLVRVYLRAEADRAARGGDGGRGSVEIEEAAIQDERAQRHAAAHDIAERRRAAVDGERLRARRGAVDRAEQIDEIPGGRVDRVVDRQARRERDRAGQIDEAAGGVDVAAQGDPAPLTVAPFTGAATLPMAPPKVTLPVPAVT